MTQYREFRVRTLINNRDEFCKNIQLLITDGDLTPVTRFARKYARDHGVTRIPKFESLDLGYGRRGIYLQALNAKNTGVIISEVFA